MENYLNYIDIYRHGDVFERDTYIDDGLSEKVEKWILGETKSENYGLTRKPKETVDAYGNKRNENGEICW